MSEPKFVTGDPMRHVAVMAFTASIGLMAMFMADLFDMLFISMLGQAALAAAIGYASAITFFTMSIGIGLSIATGALVARTLGARDPARARVYASNTLAFAFIVGSTGALIVWLCVPWLVGLLGATGETADLASRYLRIIVPFLPLLMLGMAGGAILRAHGDAKRAMWTTIIGALVNVIADPILIFGMGLGLDGAAIGSALARIAVFIAAFLPIYRHYGGLAWPSLPGFMDDLPRITGLAMPAILTNIATPIGAAYLTRTMARFGDEAVAGMAINGRLTPVAFAVVFALSGAVGPIISQNFGAKLFGRVRETLVAGLKFVLAYTVCVSIVLFLARGPIADLFSAEGLARDLVFLFCGPLSLAFFFNGALFTANAAFNNLNRPFYSTMLSWSRNTIGVIPPVMIGASLYGAQGALIGQAAGGLVFGLVSVLIAFRLIAAYEGGRIDPDSPRRLSLRRPVPGNPFSSLRGS